MAECGTFTNNVGQIESGERKAESGGRGEEAGDGDADLDRRVAEVERHYSSSNARLAAEIDSLR